jgi:tetratricopeptide (TPR) repeat protein
LAEANARYEEARFSEARERAELVESRFGPTDASLWLRAKCLQNERRFADAAKVYQQLAVALADTAGEGDRRHVDVLIDWGLSMLRDGRAAEARSILERAADLAPDYPPAVGCARFPGIMGRVLDVPREDIPARAQSADSRGPAGCPTILYFFVGRPSDPRYEEYIDLLRASATAARRVAQGARCVVLTDRHTPFPLGADLEIERFDLDRDALMIARFHAVTGYLQRLHDRGQPAAFVLCDPDTLIVRDLSPVFDGTFDVAYTWRSNFVEARLDHEPFVAGVTFVQSVDPRRPLRFFQRVLDSFDTVSSWPEVKGFYPHPIQAWRGDQIVPAAVIGWEHYRRAVLAGRSDRLRVDGVTIAFLPSDPYCYTFSSHLSDEALGARFILDFKGNRKIYLAGVAARLAAPMKGSAFPGRQGAEQHRAAAQAALARGDEARSIDEAMAYLQGIGDDRGRAVVLRTIKPEDLPSDSSMGQVVQRIEDGEATSLAELMSGIAQHVGWAKPFVPSSATLLRLSGATAIAPGLIRSADKVLLDDANGFPPSELVRHAAAGHIFLAYAEGRLLKTEHGRDRVGAEGVGAYLGVSANYAEWLLGDLPRLALMDLRAADLLCLHGNVRGYHLDALALVGITGSRLVIVPADKQVSLPSGTLFCTTTFRHHSPCATAIRALRDRIAFREPADAPSRVYLSRAGMPESRVIRNESEVEAYLRARGFSVMRPETLSVREQAGMIARAEIVVGPYGANLANLLFARAARRAVIVATKPQPEFARLASLLGIASRHVVASGTQVRSGGTYSESMVFDVDLADLERAITS